MINVNKYCTPLRLWVDGLLSPLEGGGEEPAHRQHHPPQAPRHQEEVDGHEADGAPKYIVLRLRHNKCVPRI